MAYGRRVPYRRKPTPYHRRPRTGNKAVNKALRVRPKAASTKTAANRRAVTTLARQVSRLQTRVQGQRQYNYQVCNLNSLLPADIPRIWAPIAFDVGSFYNATSVYNGTIVPGVLPGAGGTPITTSSKSFRNKAYTPLATLEPSYQWGPRSNAATDVSLISYYPHKTKIRINFRGILENDATPAPPPTAFVYPMRFRITLFKMKNRLHFTGFQNYAMPTTLAAYGSMCNDNPAERINFSKTYHTVLADRWVTLNNDPEETHSQKHVNKTVSITYTWPKGTCFKPNFVATEVPQELWHNIGAEDTVWCLLSSNQNTAITTLPIEISMSRLNIWADAHGVTV